MPSVPAELADVPKVGTTTNVNYKNLRVNWPQAGLLLLSPLISLYAIFAIPITRPTLIWTILYYFVTGLSITAGYHRLWSHRAYDGRTPLKIIFALGGAGSFQGSIRWWSRGHRAHHRHTDTDKDPYGAHRGFFWAHIGWLLFHPKDKLGYADVRDLEAEPVVAWQHRHYKWLAPFMSFVFPTLVAGFGWGDWMGGYFYAGILRLVIVHHATFCVNSLAHWLGHQNYDDLNTPRDHIVTALVTFGEGYHNFHHEFPRDYRNAIGWWQYDPTKWLIRICSWIKLAYGLRRFSHNEIRKGRVMMQEKAVIETKKTISWGTAAEDLPTYSWSEFQRECRENGHMWMVIDSFILDFASFIPDHPGGEQIIRSWRGKDATNAFNGGVHMHRRAARNLISAMRVGVIVS
ncbi:delta-9 desaturase [Syncephalis fuscata]|nr:delta-9 desaturase [Syncephalis fuscata]